MVLFYYYNEALFSGRTREMRLPAGGIESVEINMGYKSNFCSVWPGWGSGVWWGQATLRTAHDMASIPHAARRQRRSTTCSEELFPSETFPGR